MNFQNTPFFIVVDGIDGSGKTTICEYIEKKTKALYMRSLGQGLIGKAIRAQLLTDVNKYNIETTFNWVITANLEALYDYVIPALKDGQSVVLDRFFSSTYAYQLHRLPHSDLSLEFKKSYFLDLMRRVLKDAPPTLYIWCDASLETIEERLQKRQLSSNHYDQEDAVLKKKTIDGFDTFYNSNILKEKVRLNCNLPLDQVLAEVDLLISEFCTVKEGY